MSIVPPQTPVSVRIRPHVVRSAAALVLIVTLLWAYHRYGFAALPVFAALLFLGAFAAWMAVENRSLRKQMAAVEALGRSVAAGQREELPLNRFLSLANDLVEFDYAVMWI